MTKSSANKSVNGEVCHHTTNGLKPGKNGFVKNRYFDQKQQHKCRNPEEKVRPCRQRCNCTNMIVLLSVITVASAIQLSCSLFDFCRTVDASLLAIAS